MWLNACRLKNDFLGITQLLVAYTGYHCAHKLEQKQIIEINKTSLRIITGRKKSRWLFVVFASGFMDSKKEK